MYQTTQVTYKILSDQNSHSLYVTHTKGATDHSNVNFFTSVLTYVPTRHVDPFDNFVYKSVPRVSGFVDVLKKR